MDIKQKISRIVNRSPVLAVRTLVVFYLGAVIAFPMGMIFYQSIKNGFGAFWNTIIHPQALYAFKLTFISAFIVTLINMVLGTLVAYVMVRLEFVGKRFIDSLIDLPFAIPTAVTGLTLATILSPNSFIGAYLNSHGWKFLYQPSAIYIALMVVTIPFVIRAVEPLLRSMDLAEEEAAVTLGAGSWQIFFNIILPVIRSGIFSGAMLSFARSLGEFGVVVFIAGTEPFHTEIAATYIFSQIEQYNLQAAAAGSAIILMTSYFLFWLIKWLDKRQKGKRV